MTVSTTLERIPIDAILVTELRTSWRTQARFAPGSMTELVGCVSARRWLHAITVRKLGDSQYELLDGERRVIAARDAGETHIDTLVVEADDAAAAAICLLANLGGRKLRPIEKALACAQVRDALAASGANATQEAVGEWVGLRQPTVNQYLRIADSFQADVLSAVGVSADALAPYAANVLEKAAKATADDRKAWLEGVRDGAESSRPSSVPRDAEQVARHVRQLKDVCLQQQSAPSAIETAAVLVELLGVVRILAAQAATSGVEAASVAVQEGVAKVSDYRSPIIRALKWPHALRSFLLRGGASLRGAAARVAARLRRWRIPGLLLVVVSVGDAQPRGTSDIVEEGKKEFWCASSTHGSIPAK